MPVSHQRLPNRRAGAVQIEILGFLLVYTVLLLLLMAIGSVTRAVSLAHDRARESAWSQRAAATAGDRLDIDTRSLGRFLGPGAHAPPDAGVISGKGIASMVHVLPGVTDTLPSPTRQTWTMTGSWDHRQIQFAQDSDTHPPLTPDPQALRFVGRWFDSPGWVSLGEYVPGQ